MESIGVGRINVEHGHLSDGLDELALVFLPSPGPPKPNTRNPDVGQWINGEVDYTADEVFLTSTSLCICGVRLIQGRPIGDGSRRSPVTVVLKQAYVELINYAWIAQYLKRISE